jgi:putative membrane protein
MTDTSLAVFIPRGLLGGVLMGLANLVPGISGGTMLLAAGVYPSFIHSIAELTRLRIQPRPLIVLATIGGAAVAAIGLLAGPTRDLVVEHRSLTYSFFIGLTLGGLPLVWRLARPFTRSVWIAALFAFLLMVVMAFGTNGAGGGGPQSILLLVFSGVAGASAMILPGISGGYLLLLLGQYESILGSIERLKEGLIGAAGLDAVRIGEALGVLVPVGIGVVVGIVAVSNALRWLLARHEKPTLGLLIGLLLGAVVGLYPFQEPVPPEPGFAHRGVPVAPEALAEVPIEDWPLVRFTPSAGELATACGVGLAGLVLTLAISRFGEERNENAEGDTRAPSS